MIIQNNNLFTTANTTQGTTTTTGSTTGAPVTSYSDGSFADNKPSVHEQVTSSTDRIMIFRAAGVNHTFAVPAGGLVCDILMIGGGGGGGFGGGGAGACIVAINQTLPEGSFAVYVGNGKAPGYNGEDSYIYNISASLIRYLASGGGNTDNESIDASGKDGGCGSGASQNDNATTESGGAAVNTNVVNGVSGIGPIITSTYAVLGNAGGNNGGARWRMGSGGGIGAVGVSGGDGGVGRYDVSINGTTYNFRDHFANGGNSFGVYRSDTYYYIGGGGGGYDNNHGVYAGGFGGGGGYPRFTGLQNTGSGGTIGYAGGSGIIIIRYKNSTIPLPTITTPSTTTYTHQPTTTTTLSTPTLGTPSIELVRGTQGDSNTDYKIGNYNGDFIVKSSVSGVDSDYIRMLGTNGAIYNFTNSLYWTQTSDMRIKENIARASYDMCYDNIDKLELNRFNYIKEFNTGNKDTSQLGFIAQEIKDIFPKSVYTNSYSGGDLSIPDMLSIDIGQINYTLYGAVKKLMDINKDKEMRLKRLEGLLNIEDGSCNVVIDSSNVVVDTSNFVVDTSNVMVVDTSNVVVDTSNVVVDTSNLEN